MKTKIILLVLAILSIASFLFSFNTLSDYNKDRHTFECNILDIYESRVHHYKTSSTAVSYRAVILIKELDETYAINLDPVGYYNAKQARLNNKSLLYRFSQREVDEIKGYDFKREILNIILPITAMLAIVGLVYIIFLLLNLYND